MELKTKAGFTLIEALIAVTLTVMVIVSAIQIFSLVLRNNQKTRAIIQTKQTGDHALAVISTNIRNSRQIVSDCSAAGYISSSLIIEDSLGSQITISCTANGITYASNILVDGARENITLINPGACFTCYSGNGLSPDIVLAKFTLQKNKNDKLIGAELDFSTSVSLRNY